MIVTFYFFVAVVEVVDENGVSEDVGCQVTVAY